jgi:site-specific DNA-methyltransferase (adenine-specific)
METGSWKNKLYFGDNLDILREHVASATVDLIYLDPPFNSNASYNVLFQEKSGEKSAAQITAFEDTWQWGMESEYAYEEIVKEGPRKLSDLLQALRAFLGQNDMMAYITMMAQRMVELYRVLKATGSIYLHCDPTASHYLKLLMDAIFGIVNFRSEIIWRRTGTHNATRTFGPIHDVILFYSKTDAYSFNIVRRPYMKEHVRRRYREDSDGRLAFSSGGNVLTGAGATQGDSGQPWRGFDPTAKNRHWAVPRFYEQVMPDEYKSLPPTKKLEALYQAGHIRIDPGVAWPVMVRYLDERDGMPVPDIWAYQPYTEGTLHGTDQGIDADVAWMGTTDPERLGYPTQKSEGLLERIIAASSNEGDLVLDPFCGCGTTIAVAEHLKRRWIGIDITHLAISLMRHRLHDTFGPVLRSYEVIGDPKDLESARALAEENRYQFEWWALGLVDARPAQDKRKGADRGVDGYINFFDDNSGKAKTVVVQVKSGHINAAYVRDLKGVLDRDKAPIGILIILEGPTKPMLQEAAAGGFYEPEHFPGNQYPRIQILTIKELLEGKEAHYPRMAPAATFKRAKRRRPEVEQQSLDGM